MMSLPKSTANAYTTRIKACVLAGGEGSRGNNHVCRLLCWMKGRNFAPFRVVDNSAENSTEFTHKRTRGYTIRNDAQETIPENQMGDRRCERPRPPRRMRRRRLRCQLLRTRPARHDHRRNLRRGHDPRPSRLRSEPARRRHQRDPHGRRQDHAGLAQRSGYHSRRRRDRRRRNEGLHVLPRVRQCAVLPAQRRPRRHRQRGIHQEARGHRELHPDLGNEGRCGRRRARR